jgi:tetratricopeptide (TPR) repeat protein
VKNFLKFQLARSYFNQREYLRASFYLQESIDVATPIPTTTASSSSTTTTATSNDSTSVCYFLYIYAKFMSIQKKYVDNRADLLNNVDLNYLDNLQSLRSELVARSTQGPLDAYSLYVYGCVLSKLKLTDEAITVLIESVKKRPSLWCSWLELANLIKSIEVVSVKGAVNYFKFCHTS